LQAAVLRRTRGTVSRLFPYRLCGAARAGIVRSPAAAGVRV